MGPEEIDSTARFHREKWASARRVQADGFFIFVILIGRRRNFRKRKENYSLVFGKTRVSSRRFFPPVRPTPPKTECVLVLQYTHGRSGIRDEFLRARTKAETTRPASAFILLYYYDVYDPADARDRVNCTHSSTTMVWSCSSFRLLPEERNSDVRGIPSVLIMSAPKNYEGIITTIMVIK